MYFSNEDFEFIKAVFMKENTLKPYLEEDFHFKLVLHKRDFTPGATIQSNIVDAITKSRRMFMILSRSNFLIPILKEPLDIDMIPDDQQELKLYLRTHTYIDASRETGNMER